MPDRKPAGAVLIAGSASGVGKSTIAAGLCRWLTRNGTTVAPFKAQNMSNHATVTADGGEIGRAQAMQAMAARAEPTVDMNPILLKPGADSKSHVVLRGREISRVSECDYDLDDRRAIVLDAYQRLATHHDVIVAEGAGGAAEINLLDRDLVNLPFADAAGIPVVLVVDIDRGGAFASAFGTIALVPERLRRTIEGIVINGFRGDLAQLGGGLDELTARSGVPVLGVLPHLGETPLLGVEDALDIAMAPVDQGTSPRLKVAAIALPHLSNPSDLDPFATEPDVALSWTRRAGDVLNADLVVVPGSRATVADLEWLRDCGLAAALSKTSAVVFGICGGYQILGTTIHDSVESGRLKVDGLGLLDVTTTFERPKVVTQSQGVGRVGTMNAEVSGYQIRYGRVQPNRSGGTELLDLGNTTDGVADDDLRVFGTSLHGVFDSDSFRRSMLAHVADRSGVAFSPGAITFWERLEDQHERLADWVGGHLDMNALLDIIAGAAPPDDLPGWFTPGAAAS